MAWKTFGEKGRGGLDFSTVWKTFFHSVEKSLKTFFHSVEKRAAPEGGAFSGLSRCGGA